MSERPKRGIVTLVAGLTLLEAAALAAATIYLVVEIIIARSTSFSSAVALAILAAAGAVGLAFVARSLRRGASWTRGASICWQIIQILVGVSILQARGATSTFFGVALIVPAALIIVLLFTPQVVYWTSRNRES